MDGQRVGWMDGGRRRGDRTPLKQQGQMASLSEQSESQFSPAAPWENPPSSHMWADKRPWNACATL